ncbi:unnamed protein product [Mesocestoides corti]|uniref:Cadherin domain-containing protein n=1 Tax=Mesocestoides corti TaxID=53468 RepID=A0A158QTH0_MESCO|nr:unnamed protein product [Mesocestoides corti]
MKPAQHTFLLLSLLVLIPVSRGFIARFEINEGVPPESHVGSLASLGHLASGSLVYNKVPNPKDASKYFNVEKFSGRITVASELDRESLCPSPSHKPDDDCILRFSVSCLRIIGGSVEAIADVVITLRDINDNGCSFVPSPEQTVHIREDAEVDKTRIRLNSPIDPDSARLDHAIQWNQIRLEGPSSMFRLHTVHAATGNLRSSYPLEYRQQDGQLFLGLLRPLDFENTKHYHLSVVAGDGIHECKLSVNVEVGDADDNLPVFEKTAYNVTVPEDMKFNEKIITVHADDADAGEFGNVIYSLDPYLTDPQTLELFHVDEHSGDIFLKGKLNYQVATQYQLTVKASNLDRALSLPSAGFTDIQPTYLTKVYVTVEDVNDHEPLITIFSPTGARKLTLNENLPGGQDVAILTVEDKDTGMNAAVECHLKSQSIRGALALRSMTTDVSPGFEETTRVPTNRKYKLLATRSFDREAHPEVHFTVECWDGGKPVLRSVQKETLHILDVNDCSPIFDNETYHFRVFEDADLAISGLNKGESMPRMIGEVKARDNDAEENARLQYRFSPECPQAFQKLVQLDKDSGILHSTGYLDREKFASLSCKVIVNDMGTPSLSSVAEVKVEVLDVNDNPPQFEYHEYIFQISENTHVDTLVGVVRVFDADIGANSRLEFSLESSLQPTWSKHDDMGSLFASVRHHTTKSSNKYLGLLRFEVSQVRKPFPSRFHVRNSTSGDGGSAYEVRIFTAAQINREALIELPGANADDVTVVNSSGAVDLKFKLRAQDSGSPRLVNRVPLGLRVTDVNDNPPHFLFPPSESINVTEVRLSIKEPVGFQFTKVLASDPDACENGTVVYRISAGDPFDLFQLDPQSGELIVAKEYNSGHIGQYLLFIEASDSGSTRLTKETKLLVQMDDSEPLGRVERDIFGFPIRAGSRNVSSRNLNLFIIIAIIIGSFVISTVLLFAICFVVKRARREHVDGENRYHPVMGAPGQLPNGSILHDGVPNGFIKSVPLSLAQTKYLTGELMDEDLSEANFSYLASHPSNGGFPFDDNTSFQSPFYTQGANSYIAEASTSYQPMPHYEISNMSTLAAPDPDGIIRLSCLPGKQVQTISRCNFLSQRKLIEDRSIGKRNSLTDRDSGNGDSLDVATSGQPCLFALTQALDAQRTTSPCDQYIALELLPTAQGSTLYRVPESKSNNAPHPETTLIGDDGEEGVTAKNSSKNVASTFV